MAINTILLKGRGVRKEAKAGGTITPGDLVRLNSSGALIRNATAAGRIQFCVAVENDLIGKEITDDYVSGDFVQSEVLRPGDQAYCFVAAAAAAIVIGDLLEADAAGGLRKLASGQPIASSLDALDNSAGGAKARIRVDVI